MKVGTRYSKKKYKLYSIFYLISGIFLILLGAIVAIGLLPFGIFIILIGVLAFMTGKNFKKSSIEGGFSAEVENFISTSEVKGYIKFNDNTKQVLISPDENPRIVNYSDILGYELIENGKTVITKDDSDDFFDRLTHKRESTTSIQMMRIKIIVRNMNNPNAYIKFIHRDTETDSLLYRLCYENAQRVLSMLKIATSKNNKVNN